MVTVSKVLIANRGEIACRIVRTLDRMGIASVAVYSDADRDAAHVHMAGEAVRIGPPPAAESYLDINAVLLACRETGADAVHPGYGFLSENAEFAERLGDAGIRFIGPSPDHLRLFGLKHTARDAAHSSGVPLLPGSGLIDTLEEAREAASSIGYPVMLKSTAGGGGIGLQLCDGPDDLAELYERVRRLGQANFGDSSLFIEKYIPLARHIEVQIFGDGKGTVVAIGERDCSLQRRNQKVVEETPAPGIRAYTRAAILGAAKRLGESVGYASAGTVEFIYDERAREFYFLEVNARLQVEHPVTEAVTGIDFVEWMVRQAAGDLDLSPFSDGVPANGAAIEVRLYAEDPARDFQPAAGRLTEVRFPDSVRVDGWVETGTVVPAAYDPLLAKLIVSGATRDEAAERLMSVLLDTVIAGIETNLDYLRQLVASDLFRNADLSTKALAGFDFVPGTVDVLSPGAQSSLQDWPGRVGYWHVGVPPSGPMDALSHRLANRAVGNPEDAAVLEITLTGPTLRFNTDAIVALTGAEVPMHLDDKPVTAWEPVTIRAGQTLRIGKAGDAGSRAYLAVRNGFDAPLYLGSRANFGLGGFGGHATGALTTGAALRLRRETAVSDPTPVLPDCRPDITRQWDIGVLYGPHGAPDFFKESDIETLLSTPYEVHFNSARTGVRLIGPKPEWARTDGGEAGLHPSNIHDNAYAVGALDFTGDMPIILGPDGPSLGGFVCPVVVAKAELWKVGQLKAGDAVRFVALSLSEADALEKAQEDLIRELRGPTFPLPAIRRSADALESAIRLHRPDRPIPVTYRRTGEDYLLVEFGSNVLDLDLRVQVHNLMTRLEGARIESLIDVTPGIRSLQLHYDNRAMSEACLLDVLDRIEGELPPLDDAEVPSRIVHLPLAWDDSQTRLATKKYQDLVRPDAPWCPWNIEFIRRINGLASVEDVRRTVYGADYMVYGLGDVYLGAPVATPVDPRHRLVTTKYNPARTWTPENAVGIGGAYLCIYGMEGPGGYQFVGRTVQVWNTWRQTENFVPGKPWLLRFFDRIRFYPVDEAELLEMREAFPHGRFEVETEEETFVLADYHRMLIDNHDEIEKFRFGREAAFATERERWTASGVSAADHQAGGIEAPAAALQLPDGATAIESPVPGNVWTLAVGEGDLVRAGEPVAVLESMKMEITVDAPVSGRISRVLAAPGRTVEAGEPLFVVESSG